MNTASSSAKPWGRKAFKWIAGIIACCLILFCVVPTLIYFFLIPSQIERVIGEKLPKSATVVNSQYDYVPHDPTHRFAIAFTDDRARDRLIAKYRLTNKPEDIMGSSTSQAPSWWPATRLNAIEQSGECYGRVDNASEKWWTIWIDRQSNTLYFEAGAW